MAFWLGGCFLEHSHPDFLSLAMIFLLEVCDSHNLAVLFNVCRELRLSSVHMAIWWATDSRVFLVGYIVTFCRTISIIIVIEIVMSAWPFFFFKVDQYFLFDLCLVFVFLYLTLTL